MRLALLLAIGCAHNTEKAEQLTSLEAELMSADYRGDLDALVRLQERAGHFLEDRDLDYLARYWSGFASWRLAINGANQKMKPEEITEHLKKAAAEFYLSIQLKKDFADGYAAAAGVNGWLIAFLMTTTPDEAGARERMALFQTLMARATELDPDNPRVLWIQAAPLMFSPPERGGNISAAIELYERMLRSAERDDGAPSPLPDWGEPEALMSLAFAHMQKKPPDLTAARDLAKRALALQPEWSYVKDMLLPQIEQRSIAR